MLGWIGVIFGFFQVKRLSVASSANDFLAVLKGSALVVVLNGFLTALSLFISKLNTYLYLNSSSLVIGAVPRRLKTMPAASLDNVVAYLRFSSAARAADSTVRTISLTLEASKAPEARSRFRPIIWPFLRVSLCKGTFQAILRVWRAISDSLSVSSPPSLGCVLLERAVVPSIPVPRVALVAT